MQQEKSGASFTGAVGNFLFSPWQGQGAPICYVLLVAEGFYWVEAGGAAGWVEAGD